MRSVEVLWRISFAVRKAVLRTAVQDAGALAGVPGGRMQLQCGPLGSAREWRGACCGYTRVMGYCAQLLVWDGGIDLQGVVMEAQRYAQVIAGILSAEGGGALEDIFCGARAVLRTAVQDAGALAGVPGGRMQLQCGPFGNAGGRRGACRGYTRVMGYCAQLLVWDGGIDLQGVVVWAQRYAQVIAGILGAEGGGALEDVLCGAKAVLRTAVQDAGALLLRGEGALSDGKEDHEFYARDRGGTRFARIGCADSQGPSGIGPYRILGDVRMSYDRMNKPELIGRKGGCGMPITDGKEDRDFYARDRGGTRFARIGSGGSQGRSGIH